MARLARPKKIEEEVVQLAEVSLSEVVYEIIKSAAVVVMGGAGFIITIKVLQGLIALIGTV